MRVIGRAKVAVVRVPDEATVEGWAYRYIASDELAYKLAPDALPAHWGGQPTAISIERPGRPAALRLAERGEKTPGSTALRDPARRARLLHTFLHHELQAAELMCRAVLAFPDTPAAFRRGLIGICLDEIRHMGMYAEHMATLGFGFGDFPVNDWFWQRVPGARTAAEFVAVMGLGFEGANLDHTQRFAHAFRLAGDERGAALQERIGAEEVPHVAFGAHWFGHFRGELAFDAWAEALPAPLSPMLMRGRPLNRLARRAAGYSDAFVERLERWLPDQPGS
jgi:uncharacterized ferritin-like protein (DUF455 family)